MSIAGICYAVARAPKVIPPSAVASVLLRIPLMKQVCTCNMCKAVITLDHINLAVVYYAQQHLHYSSGALHLLVIAAL
jgi:hypothetical protein